MNEHDKSHLGEILKGEGTYFTAHLLRLISKADESNRTLLGKVYPEEVRAVSKFQGRPLPAAVPVQKTTSPRLSSPMTFPRGTPRDLASRPPELGI